MYDKKDLAWFCQLEINHVESILSLRNVELFFEQHLMFSKPLVSFFLFQRL